MSSFSLTKWNNNLLKERKRFVNVGSFSENLARCSCLFGAFTTSKIDQVKFGVNNLVTWFNTWSALNRDSKNGVCSGWSSIHIVRSKSTIHLTFEKTVKCLFLSVTNVLRKAFNRDTSALIIFNLEWLSSIARVLWNLLAKQVSYLLIIDLRVTDANSHSLIKFRTDCVEYLLNCPGHEASVLKGVSTAHGVCFTRTSLTIAHDSAVETFDNRLNNLCASCLISLILWSIVQDLFKLELPCISLIIDHTFVLLVDLKCDSTGCLINLNVLRWKVISWSGTNYNLNCLFTHWKEYYV